MTMTTAQGLTDARALLVDGGWCKEHYAIDAEGKACDPEDDCATAFCMIGALHKITGVDDKILDIQLDLLRTCISETEDSDPSMHNSIVSFNDYVAKDVSEVLAIYDCAIKKAQTA